MSFMDELKKLTQPFDDEEDFFEGADESAKASAAAVTSAQAEFEQTFGEEAPAAEEQSVKKAPKPSEGGILGALGALAGKKAAPKPQKAPVRERTVNFGGGDTQVILFSPKSFDEAGELVNHILQGRSVVMTLEGIGNENARRLLDFMSGIAFALQGKITPVSAKTYFVTPQNVDLVGAQNAQAENSEKYF